MRRVMKVSDLPENEVIDAVRIKVPDDVLEEFKDFAGGEPEMYVVGNVMGYGFMMSPDPPGNERRLYPMPMSVKPSDILLWEVA